MSSVITILLGGFPCRIHLPTDPVTPPALLYVHGGVPGGEDVNSREDLCEKLAAEARCAVVSLHCSSETECLLPATFEHVIGAWAELVERASSLNIDPARLGIAGDGTGARLAAALVITCRSADQSLQPRLQILLHPVAGNSVTRASGSESAQDVPLTAAMMYRFVDPHSADCPATAGGQALSLSAGELASMPAAFILTSGRDSLLDEGLAYAARLADAGSELAHVHLTDQIQGLLTQRRLRPDRDSVLVLAAAFARKHLRRSAAAVPISHVVMRDR